MNPNDKEEEQLQSKVSLKNLKSNFILKKIFSYLLVNNILKIVNYNKQFQNKLYIGINDYKEGIKKLSSIEIELKPDDNKYGKFINISDENKNDFLIYFNNSNEIIRRNNLKENEKVKIIKIKINYRIKSFKDLFCNCKTLSSISFKKFYRNNITDMSSMFLGCSSLKELNFSNFVTDSVADMRNMFYGCSSLKELNLSKFNTNNVTNMSGMFYRCSSLEELNLSNFNTINVTNMSFMFDGCLSLKVLDISNFNTVNVTHMNFMFWECESVKELNISNFNTDNAFNIDCILDGCSNELEKKIRKYITFRF